MPNLCDKINFRDKLNIFISSAMNDENGFNWRKTRKVIEERLNECPIFNAFIIEEHGSPISSTQLFKSKVEISDIIILFLKDTVRQGTLQEFDIVKKKHKKMIAYFIKSNCADLSISEVKSEIINLDYCTFYEYDPSSDEKIEDIVFNHIMESLVDWYRMGKIITDETYTFTNISPYVNSLPKLILQNFNSCYGKTFDILNIKIYGNKNKDNKEKSKLHDIGIDMLKWLLTGSDFPSNEEFNQIVLSMKELFNDTLWLKKRWEACKCMANNNFKQALKYESAALELAEKGNLPEWIITDILIDCRNIANSIYPFNGKDYQKRLSEINELVYFPGLDRFCYNLFNDTIDEYQRESFKSRGEIRFGNNLRDIITEFENCLFISMLYGSYTKIVSAREALEKVLYHFGIIYNGHNFMFIAAKLQVLCGNSKKFEKIVNHEWESIGNELITNANDLLTLAIKLSNDDIILVIIKKFIVYFNDQSIKLATDYLLNLSLKTEYDRGDNIIKAINFAIDIMSSEDIIKILINLLKRKVIQTYKVFTETLINLDISNVDDNILYDFCDIIKCNAEEIVKNNGNPQYIAVLINQRSDIFNCLKNVPNNGLVDDELIIFDINTNSNYDSKRWQEILCCQIYDIEQQMKINSKEGFYSEFYTKPFMTVKSFIESTHCNFMDIKEIIDDKLIPLCIQILKNNIVISLTNECVDCLISIVIKCKKNKFSISTNLIDFLNSSEDIADRLSYTFSPFNGDLSNSIKYRYLMLKMLCMVDVREEMYYNYLNYFNKNELDRIAISECLKEYFDIMRDNISDPILVSLAFLLSNDSSYEVRVNACVCMYCLTLNKEYSNLSYLKLRELSTDTHPNVRYKLLEIYKNDYMARDDKKYRDIISNLVNDAHYLIRLKANEVLL